MNSPAAEFLPLIKELAPLPDVEAAFMRLASRPHCLFLDSALRQAELGRYSYLSADPFAFTRCSVDGSDPLVELESSLQLYATKAVAELPPFQGGAAGLLSYDLNRAYEQVPASRFDEFGLPALALGWYDVVLAYDHVAQRAWLISQGLPEREPSARQRRAKERLEQFERWLAEPPNACGMEHCSVPRIAAQQLSKQFSVPGPRGLTSNFSADAYRAAVQQAIDYIHAGDVFQVNIAQRLLYPAATASPELYLRLRRRNPAPFAAYFDGGDFQLAGASPERFLSVHKGLVETRPIKGTRRRSPWPEADLFAGDELLASEKDRAENVMIVDLLRNDLARVCHEDSVRVTKLCGLESYQFVQHLVSVVQGQLRAGETQLSAVRAAFPGGSITGAPKVRAMEIIAELEPTARGAYCGALGYFSLDGAVDLNILIRTITAARGWWQLPVGGGIVAQSQPQQEYQETWHKAEGLLRSLLE